MDRGFSIERSARRGVARAAALLVLLAAVGAHAKTGAGAEGLVRLGPGLKGWSPAELKRWGYVYVEPKRGGQRPYFRALPGRAVEEQPELAVVRGHYAKVHGRRVYVRQSLRDLGGWLQTDGKTPEVRKVQPGTIARRLEAALAQGPLPEELRAETRAWLDEVRRAPGDPSATLFASTKRPEAGWFEKDSVDFHVYEDGAAVGHTAMDPANPTVRVRTWRQYSVLSEGPLAGYILEKRGTFRTQDVKSPGGATWALELTGSGERYVVRSRDGRTPLLDLAKDEYLRSARKPEAAAALAQRLAALVDAPTAPAVAASSSSAARVRPRGLRAFLSSMARLLHLAR